MYFEEIEKDREIDLGQTLIEKKEMLAFANAYDPSPIHTDEEFAKQSRFGELLAPGTLSFIVNWAKWIRTGIMGEELLAGTSCLMEWLNPVFDGDILTGIAIVTDKKINNKYNGTITVIIKAFNQDGVQVVNSVSKAVIKRKPVPQEEQARP